MEQTTIDQLCEGVPFEFMHFMSYCRQLKFDEQPNYDYLVTTLDNCLKWLDLEENDALSERCQWLF